MNSFCDAHFHSSHAPFPKKKEFDPEALYLSCSAGPEDWLRLLNTRQIKPFLGLHPEQTDSPWPSLLKRLEELIQENPGAGIGECGLDKRYYKRLPRIEQEEILIRQIRIAERYGRPVVLHQVGAPGALADLLLRLKSPAPMMIHGFRESREILERYLSLGMYISVGPGRHWKDKDFLKTVHQIPRKRLLLETDWPYCRYEGNREGKTSPESYSDCLSEHYRRVSLELGIDINSLSRLVKENGTFFTN